MPVEPRRNYSPPRCAAALCALLAGNAHATHFRFGHITWGSDSGTEVQVTIQNAWRRDAYSTGNSRCIDVATLTSVPCTGPGGLAGIGDVIVEQQGFTTFNWGDGSPPLSSPLGALLYLVTSIDIADNWLFGLALDPNSLPLLSPLLRHSYAVPGSYLAYEEDCCRISAVDPPYEHINNPDGDYRVETRIHTPSIEHSPVSMLPPIVNCPRNAPCSFLALGGDQDGGPVHYRLSTAAEASDPVTPQFVQPGPPDAPLSAHTGELSGVYGWNSSGAQLAQNPNDDTLYSTQITLTDATSKSALDFLVRLVQDQSAPPRISSAPNSIPICNTFQLTSVEEPLDFTLFASDPDAGDAVRFNAVGLPFGADTVPPLPQHGNPVQTTFQWTPSAAQGSDGGMPYVVDFFATSTGGQQALCPVSILVFTGVPCDIDGDADVDTNDIAAIFDARNTPATGPDDARDVDSDAWVTVHDARYCVFQCDEADCAAPAVARTARTRSSGHTHAGMRP
jgi:hypothetical protein